jgi:hypothetical protein
MIKVKVIISIIIIIIIIITGTLIIFTPNEETSKNEIEEKWVKSGPFSIDKIEYNLGEKIFISVNNLKEEDKGQVIFYRQLNSTAWLNYIAMDFDGKNKSRFNLYFEPRLNEVKEICSTNDLAGTWMVKFIGTEYLDINFKIMNQTSSWDTRTFEPIC